MAVIGGLIKGIFTIILLVAVFLIGIISFIFLRVRRMTKTFRDGMGAANNKGAANGNRNGKHSQQNTTSNTNKRRSAEYDDGVVVEEELYDNRSRSEANRKIFAKDEGEYVDYEEEK